MSRRYTIHLVAGLALCAMLAFVVLPRTRAHAQAKLSFASVNVSVLPMDNYLQV